MTQAEKHNISPRKFIKNIPCSKRLKYTKRTIAKKQTYPKSLKLHKKFTYRLSYLQITFYRF